MHERALDSERALTVVGVLIFVLGTAGLLVADLTETKALGRTIDLLVTVGWVAAWVVFAFTYVRLTRLARGRNHDQVVLASVAEARALVLRDESPRDAVVEAVRRVTGARLCLLSEPHDDALVTTACAGASVGGVRLPLDRPSIARRVLTSGQSLRILNIHNETGAAAATVAAMEELLDTRVHSVAYVPVVAHGEVLGVLSAAFEVSDLGLADSAMPILELLAAEVAVGLERERLLEQLRATDEWRSALMATLAHDIRSPLTSVTGALDLLDDDGATPDHLRPFVGRASAQADRIMRLSAGLLDLARIQGGRLQLDRNDTRVVEVAAKVAGLFRREDHVRVDISPDLWACADADRLEQILFNLISNSVRHGRPPIVVSASEVHAPAGAEGSCVEIRVTDHGDGVAPDLVPGLFDRFVHREESQGSVGLGMWIVKLLVQAHGGDVRYEDAGDSGAGASFVVALPVARVARDAVSTVVL